MHRLILLAFAGALALVAVAAPAAAFEDPNPQADQWRVAEHVITFQDVPAQLPADDADPRTTVNATIAFHEFEYQGNAYTADEFREAYDRGHIGDRDVERFEAEVRSGFRLSLETLMPIEGTPTTTPAHMTRDSLEAPYTGSDYHPPLVVTVEGGGPLDLSALAGANVTAKRVAIAFELGASFDVPLSLEVEPGNNVTAHVHAPEDAVWRDAVGAAVSDDGALATVEASNWKGTTVSPVETSLNVTNPEKKAFEEEDVGFNVTVDLQGLDLQPTQFPAGSAGLAKGNVSVVGNVRVAELPEDAPDELRRAGVTHVSAEDIRILVDEGLVDASDIDDQVSQVASAFQGDTPDRVDLVVAGGLVEESLEAPDEAGSETDHPIQLHVTADVFVDLAWGASGDGQALRAVSLYTLDRSVGLPSLEGYDTDYEVIAPAGIALEDVQVDGEPAEVFSTEDGRDAFRATVAGGEESEAQIQAAVTLSFLWHQAGELVLLLALLVLLPLLLLVLLLRRRGGGEEPTRVAPPGGEGGSGGSGSGEG